MQITLKPEHEQFIQAQIANGKFASADEAADIAFRLLEKLSRDSAQWIEETRAKVDEAIAELDRGEGLDGESVIDPILERFRQARKASQ
jgi:antitoxin ParD1/3/4